MRKAFLKYLARRTLLALTLSSLPAFAGYSEDADCARVSNGARDGAQRAAAAIDDAAKATGAAVEQAKSCVDSLVGFSTRSISDFGGGIQIPDSLRKQFAQQGCKVLSAAQTKIQTEFKSGVDGATAGIDGGLQNAIKDLPSEFRPAGQNATSNIKNQIATPGNTSSPAPSLSVFQRLANIF